MINVFWEKLESRTDPHGCSSTTHGVVPTLQVIGNTFSFSFEKAALYLRFEQLKNRLLAQQLLAAAPELNAPLRRAANDAAALAWATVFPLLVFPVLFEGKTDAAVLRAGRQARIYANSQLIAA